MPKFNFEVEKLEIEGETFYLRPMSVKSFLAVQSEGENKELGVRILQASLCDASGKPSEDDVYDFPLYVVNDLVRAAMKVNRLDEDSFDAAKKN